MSGHHAPHDRLLNLGTTLASQGYSVILDAKYDRQALRSPVIAQAVAHQIPLEILYCDAPMSVLSDRVQQRQGDISDATADLLKTQHMEPFSEAERLYLRTLDTTQTLDEQLPK
ncbi:MAG: AAA family ATPase [Phormidesmis sp. CAN_BIN44]|nr:AAA family ATPase [Phormidesmis sp. CAN_BIN44]